MVSFLVPFQSGSGSAFRVVLLSEWFCCQSGSGSAFGVDLDRLLRVDLDQLSDWIWICFLEWFCFQSGFKSMNNFILISTWAADINVNVQMPLALLLVGKVVLHVTVYNGALNVCRPFKTSLHHWIDQILTCHEAGWHRHTAEIPTFCFRKCGSLPGENTEIQWVLLQI